jgi:hypothetical protein
VSPTDGRSRRGTHDPIGRVALSGMKIGEARECFCTGSEAGGKVPLERIERQRWPMGNVWRLEWKFRRRVLKWRFSEAAIGQATAYATDYLVSPKKV